MIGHTPRPVPGPGLQPCADGQRPHRVMALSGRLDGRRTRAQKGVPEMLLAGDIGGTKTDLAVFSAEKGPRAPLAQARFHSADYPGLESMAREFLAQVHLPVSRACFGVAGPVVGGRARLTNLPWLLEETALREALNFQGARLLNDLEAIANAVPHLVPGDLHTLHAGPPASGGAIAVIAPGTGLGEAFLTWEGTEYHAHPSEGGHADFAP